MTETSADQAKGNTGTADREPPAEVKAATSPESGSETPPAVTEGDTAAPRPLNKPAIILAGLALAAVFTLAYMAFSSQVLLFFAGMFVFLGIYPMIAVHSEDKTRKILTELGIFLGLCVAFFLVLKLMFPQSDDQAEVLAMFILAMGARLVIYPVYNYEGED